MYRSYRVGYYVWGRASAESLTLPNSICCRSSKQTSKNRTILMTFPPFAALDTSAHRLLSIKTRLFYSNLCLSQVNES